MITEASSPFEGKRPQAKRMKGRLAAGYRLSGGLTQKTTLAARGTAHKAFVILPLSPPGTMIAASPLKHKATPDKPGGLVGCQLAVSVRLTKPRPP